MPQDGRKGRDRAQQRQDRRDPRRFAFCVVRVRVEDPQALDPDALALALNHPEDSILLEDGLRVFAGLFEQGRQLGRPQWPVFHERSGSVVDLGLAVECVPSTDYSKIREAAEAYVRHTLETVTLERPGPGSQTLSLLALIEGSWVETPDIARTDATTGRRIAPKIPSTHAGPKAVAGKRYAVEIDVEGRADVLADFARAVGARRGAHPGWEIKHSRNHRTYTIRVPTNYRTGRAAVGVVETWLKGVGEAAGFATDIEAMRRHARVALITNVKLLPGTYAEPLPPTAVRRAREARAARPDRALLPPS